MNKDLEVEIKVGLFVTIGVILIAFLILVFGGGRSVFGSNVYFKTTFHEVEGIVEGAIVKISGVRVGQVDKITFLKNSGDVELTLAVKSKYAVGVHKDATVGIKTHGVLGDRYIIINPGTPNSPLAEEGDSLQPETVKELKDYLNNADEVISRLKSSITNLDGILEAFNKSGRADNIFKNLSQMSYHLNQASQNLTTTVTKLNSTLSSLDSIAHKIDSGKGTLGAFVNDASLYDDMKALLGGANRNRVLKYFVRKSVEEAREEQEKQK